MDTRTKIVTVENAVDTASNRDVILYYASFDVLTAGRVRRVREIARPDTLLIAVIAPSANSLLPAKARAELAAALAIIDLVVAPTEPFSNFRAQFPAATIVDDTDADLRRTAEFIEHVHQRNSTAAE